MPDIYKIGYTDRAPMQRCEELSSSTSIPTPFNLVFYCECESPSLIESELHRQFSENRISHNREFFRFDIKQLMEEVYISFQESGFNNTTCDRFVHYSYNHHILINQENSQRNLLIESKDDE